MNACCNGKSTNFCPICGEPILGNNKKSLIAFLEAKFTQSNQCLENAHKHLAQQKAEGLPQWDLVYTETRVERHKRKAAKWQAWLTIVQEPLLAKELREVAQCAKCGHRLALARLDLYHATPDQEPYTDGVVEPVIVYGEERDEINVSIEDVGCHVCSECRTIESVWIESSESE